MIDEHQIEQIVESNGKHAAIGCEVCGSPAIVVTWPDPESMDLKVGLWCNECEIKVEPPEWIEIRIRTPKKR